MSYPLMTEKDYERTLGPVGTPNWQLAPVPGWGVDPDYSARSRQVAVDGVSKGVAMNLSTMNDLALPRYSQVAARVPRGDAFEHLELAHGGVPEVSYLPMAMQIRMATKRPAPPFSPVRFAPILPRDSVETWQRTQGGYFPLSGDPAPTPTPAAQPVPYNIGHVLLAGSGGLIIGMMLTWAWMRKE